MSTPRIPWLLECTGRWPRVRAKFLFHHNENRPVRDDDGVVTAFRDGQVTLRENRRTDGFTIAILEQGYQGVRVGDLVLHSMDAFAGAIGVSESDGKCTPEYVVVNGDEDRVENRYFAYLLRQMALRDYIRVICPSVRERAPRFRYPRFQEVLLPAPPVATQRAIAAYLDRKTAAIDDLIAKKERLLALLAEKRAALIHQAVTKGLDPSVPMKDSGIPAFSRIPAHWRTTKPKYACSRIVDGTHHTPTYVETGVPFITVRNLTAGPGISFDDTKFVSRKAHEHLIQRAHPEKGDLLISKDGTLGVTRVIETDREFSIFVSVALLKLIPGTLDPWFLRYCFESDALWQQFESRKTGSGLKHLILSDIGAVDVPCPPLEEQRRISAGLRERIRVLEGLDARVRTSRDHLREYRQALITAAVTGQLDLTAPAAEPAPPDQPSLFGAAR